MRKIFFNKSLVKMCKNSDFYYKPLLNMLIFCVNQSNFKKRTKKLQKKRSKNQNSLQFPTKTKCKKCKM